MKSQNKKNINGIFRSTKKKEFTDSTNKKSYFDRQQNFCNDMNNNKKYNYRKDPVSNNQKNNVRRNINGFRRTVKKTDIKINEDIEQINKDNNNIDECNEYRILDIINNIEIDGDDSDEIRKSLLSMLNDSKNGECNIDKHIKYPKKTIFRIPHYDVDSKDLFNNIDDIKNIINYMKLKIVEFKDDKKKSAFFCKNIIKKYIELTIFSKKLVKNMNTVMCKYENLCNKYKTIDKNIKEIVTQNNICDKC